MEKYSAKIGCFGIVDDILHINLNTFSYKPWSSLRDVEDIDVIIENNIVRITGTEVFRDFIYDFDPCEYNSEISQKYENIKTEQYRYFPFFRKKEYVARGTYKRRITKNLNVIYSGKYIIDLNVNEGAVNYENQP